MDETTFLALLRAELNIPTGLTPTERIAELEEAFRAPQDILSYHSPFESSGETALGYISEGDERDFYGHLTLYAAFGGSYDTERELRISPRDGDWMKGLRRRAYRYAVIEYEKRTWRQKTTERAVSIALRLTPRLLYGEATLTLDGAVETLKLRDGLMNKRQATLLAEHLNSKLVHARRDTWRVVEGPDSDGNARTWLDALGSTYQLMRRESGETAAWGLGGAATRGIATFRVEKSPTLSSHQVFSILPPRVVLPPRYLLACVSLEDESRYLAADQYSWVGARRLHPSLAATELFQLVTASNLLPAKPEARHWEHSLRGFFYDQHRPHDDCSEYAHGFTAEEAEEVQDILKRNGYGDFEPVRIGCDGNFNPLGFNDIVGTGKLVVPGQAPLHVELFSYRG